MLLTPLFQHGDGRVVLSRIVKLDDVVRAPIPSVARLGSRAMASSRDFHQLPRRVVGLCDYPLRPIGSGLGPHQRLQFRDARVGGAIFGDPRGIVAVMVEAARGDDESHGRRLVRLPIHRLAEPALGSGDVVLFVQMPAQGLCAVR